MPEAFTAPSPERLDRFAAATGVPPAAQVRRLRHLYCQGVPVDVALRHGLIRDGMVERWADYVWDDLRRWNLAASGRLGRPGILTLGDKITTAGMLRRAGLPTVPSHLLSAGAEAVEVTGLLGQWPELFIKPNRGSRGRNSYRVTAAGDVIPYQSGSPLDDGRAALQAALTTESYLAQPRLTSHPDLAPAADDHDVVTLRVVTRHHPGEAPEFFSAALELPRSLDGGPALYDMLRVGPDGTVGGSPRPAWLLPGSTDRQPQGGWLSGQRLDIARDAVLLAPAAHRLFPHVYAIAWDVALCEEGPLLLEGNGGFGTIVPQWLAGGLLAGRDPRSRN